MISAMAASTRHSPSVPTNPFCLIPHAYSAYKTHAALLAAAIYPATESDILQSWQEKEID